MSDPKVKPSIAARELANSKAAIALAEKCRNLSAPYDYATLIQAELRDLLDKAQTLNVYIEARWGDSDATIQGLNRPLKSALEPWKPGE